MSNLEETKSLVEGCTKIDNRNDRKCNISIVLPSRKRPLILQRMFDSALTTAKYPDLIEMSVYIDNDDIATQEHLKTMKGNIQVTIGDRIIHSDMYNKAYAKATADIVIFCGDDCVFRSKDWDEKVMNVFDQYEDKIVLVYGDDLIPCHGKNLGTSAFLHRRWIETLGYLLPPYFSWGYADLWLDGVAYTLNRKVYLPDVIIEHIQWESGKVGMDEVNKENLARADRDKPGELYKQLADKKQIDIEKLRAVMK